MSRRTAVLLAVAIVVLLLVYVALREREVPVSEGPLAEPVLEAEILPELVGTVRVRGPQGGEAILERAEDGWRVANLASARAEGERVEELLKSLQGLSGEVRAETREVFDDFSISDEQGVHLELIAESGDFLCRLVVGEPSPDWRGGFLRREGDQTVYFVRKNLRGLMRIRGSQEEPKVEPDAWADLRLLQIEPADIVSLRLESPAGAFTVARVELPEAPPEAGAEAPDTRWVLLEPSDVDADPEELGRVVRSFARMRAQRVARPDETLRAGLDAPERRAEAAQASGEAVSVLVGDEAPGENGARYVRVSGLEVDYVLAAWVANDLFKSLEKAPEEEAEPE
jgi:hypothetical protein